ncbi:MAG: hypothetical protein COT25_00635 [Candidatus Kerfeldbacteria bacterium CG08_land_8_20_14_0_20_42_7]|uniref:Glycosyltransferase RgtA/B/C/D-like domain-containing protein n=1 Tax=Candidatus Kerfeldbacteria bacterium CG08_land_8_20_14_0_20_42_7 TaxID=2014245 RepID=A0A2H0YTQ9_9BACT|nr:MAG: hypothetical protein COT25_00635 [Candidatus Kerfeldbacteria bacterium CG08_land_8_20_14_0_20_42_7]
MKKVFLIFLIWFLAINVFALLPIGAIHVSKHPITGNDNPLPQYVETPSWSLTRLHPHWDEYWYLSVVQRGYFDSQDALFSNAAFFPLYPMTISALDVFIHNPIITGVILSSLCLLLAVWMLYLLVKDFHPKIPPIKPIIYLLLFPTAFFLVSMYTESMFLFLSITCFYFLLKKNFWIAGIFGFLAALTRITGVFLVIPFIWELYMAYKPKLWRKELLSVLGIPLAVIAYFTYLGVKFHNFFLFFKAQADWGRNFSFSHFSFLPSSTTSYPPLDMLCVVFGVVAGVYLIRKIRVSYGLYVLAVIAATIASGSLLSMERILLVLFPLYIALAHIKNKKITTTWLVASTLLLSVFTLLFVQGSWAG